MSVDASLSSLSVLILEWDFGGRSVLEIGTLENRLHPPPQKEGRLRSGEDLHCTNSDGRGCGGRGIGCGIQVVVSGGDDYGNSGVGEGCDGSIKGDGFGPTEGHVYYGFSGEVESRHIGHYCSISSQ